MSTTLRARAADAAYGAGWALVRWLPEPLARAMFAALADFVWWRRGDGIRRYEANLRPLLAVSPGAAGAVDAARLRAVSRSGMRSYLRYWCEAFRLPAIDLAEVVRRTRAENPERLLGPTSEGRGVIGALPHMANWDQAGAWACGVGMGVTAVAERLRPESLFDRFVAYRESLGMQIVPLDGNPDSFSELTAAIRAGRVVALVADRDLTARGVDVMLCGTPARMPAGPAALALRTGAPLVPVTLWYDGPTMVLRCHEPIRPPDGLHGRRAVEAMTQQLADVFGPALREHPEDWHMLQRFWLSPEDAASVPRGGGGD